MLHLRFFASCADQAGVADAQCEFSPTPKDLLSRVSYLAKFQDISHIWVAVNRQWSQWDAVLSDGDEVAFTPPVGGG